LCTVERPQQVSLISLSVPEPILTISEFNDHQRDVFCVFSGIGVQRLRNYLNVDTGPTHPQAFHADGTMFDASEDPDDVGNVTAQANGMAIDEDEDFGEGSEMMGQD
jgi:F-box and leucine-rich repeat protein GRR1